MTEKIGKSLNSFKLKHTFLNNKESNKRFQEGKKHVNFTMNYEFK